MTEARQDSGNTSNIETISLRIRTLKDLAIYIKNSEKLSEFLGPRMFDPGMIKPLNPMRTPSLYENPNNFEYENKNLPAAPVFSSGMARRFIDNDYIALATVDIKNLFGANQVYRLNGDRLLREFALSIAEQMPDYKIVRLGGDEFGIFGKEKENEIDRDLLKRFEADFEKLKSKKPKKTAFYKTDRGIELDEISFKRHDPNTTRSLFQNNRQKEERPLYERVEMIIQMKPSLKDILIAPNGAITENERVIALIEDVMYDPILHEKNKDKRVAVYKDSIDFFESLQNFKGTTTVMRIEIPGALKQINDETGLGYQTGSKFLIEVFNKIVSSYSESGIVSPITIYRRGGEFFVAVQNGEPIKKLSDSLKTNLTGWYQIEYDIGKDKKTIGFPLIPVIAIGEVRKEKLQKDQFNQFASLFEELDDSIQVQTAETMFAYYKDKDEAAGEWIFLSQYFSPLDKRGILRLKKAGITESFINELKNLYNDQNSRETIVHRMKVILSRQLNTHFYLSVLRMADGAVITPGVSFRSIVNEVLMKKGLRLKEDAFLTKKDDLRFFLDAVAEYESVSDFIREKFTEKEDVLKKIAENRIASKALGYYSSILESSSYFDDANIYVNDVMLAFKNVPNKEIEVFMRKIAEELIANREDIKNAQVSKILNLTKERAILKILYGALKSGMVE